MAESLPDDYFVRPASGTECRKIAMSEVEKRSSSDCWIVIKENVYDVSNFLEEHPGGSDVLLQQAGKDATKAFKDVGHSKDAKKMMEKYKIGILKCER